MRPRAGQVVTSTIVSLTLYLGGWGLAPHVRDPIVSILERVTLYRVFLILASAALLTSASPLFAPRRAFRPTYRLGPWAATVALGVLVGLAASAWYVVGSTTTLPIVFWDELSYSNLAKSLALGDGLRIWGVTAYGYNAGYAVFLAPFYALAGNGADAYESIQTAQAYVMASAAFPAYLLARRLISRERALLCAALSVAIPHLHYSTLVMTEPLFYPAFLWFCLAAVSALDDPTVARQAIVIASLAITAAVRVQAVILGVALVTAIVIRPDDGGRRAALRRWVPTLALLGVAATGVAVALAAGAHPLGGYQPHGVSGGYSSLVATPNVFEAIAWAGRLVGVLSLAVGIVLMAAFAPALARLLQGTPSERSMGALVTAVVAWVIASVAQYSTTPGALGLVHERNVFFLVPLVVIAVLAWARRGLPRPRSATVLGSLAMIASVGFLRQRDLLNPSDVDTPSFPLWRSLDSAALPASRLVLLSAIVAAAVALSTRRGWILPLTAGVVMLGAISVPADAVDRATVRKLAWVDDIAGRRAGAIVVHAGLPDRCVDRDALEKLGRYTEFFNISAARAAHIFADNPATNLSSPELTIARDGTLLEQGRPLPNEWVVLDARVLLAGRRAAVLSGNILGDHPGTRTALALWQVERPARVTNTARVKALTGRSGCPDDAS